MSTGKQCFSRPTFPSTRFSCSSRRMPDSPNRSMRTHTYSKFMQQKVPLYDKTFSPIKSEYRITKNRPKQRRSLEVTRLNSIDQREQYRRLIEQYRKSTLKDVPGSFELPKRANELDINTKENDSIIDLTEKSYDNRSKQKNTQESYVVKPSFENKENIFSRGSMVKESNIAEKLSSAYVSKNFIPDLIKSFNRRERQRKAELLAAETRAKLQREKREAKEALLSEILHKKLQLLEDEKKEDKLEELTLEMNDVINNALLPYPANEVLCQKYNISITREHISTLFGLNWLNDEIINFYMEMIVERSKTQEGLPSIHAMNTFFFPKLSSQAYNSVRRWTKKVDIFSKDVILFPIHLGVHWCLAVADFRKKEIRYYDSMGGANRECLLTLRDYLVSEHKNKKGADYDVSDWQLISMSAIPQQMNGSDCGVFTCKFAEYIALSSELTFSQSDMPYFRRAMVWEIVSMKLLR